MLIIRDAQIRTFQHERRRAWVVATADEIMRQLPNAAAKLSADELVEMVETAADRAPQYGIRTEPGIAIFAKLMLALGDYFDEDLEWAREILVSERRRTEHARCSALVDAATRHLEVSAGGD